MQDFAQAIPMKHRLTSLRDKLAMLFTDIGTGFHTARNTLSNAFSTRTKTVFNKKKVGTYLFFIIVIVMILFGFRFVIQKILKSNNQVSQVNDVLTTAIGKDFSFKAYDADKKIADSIKYTITNAQLTKQIIIKGQKATAVKDRTFLILNLKLVNDTNKSLFLNTRNYVRVQPKGIEDKLAPEIHNDTVEMQPLSTKLTRIGLPVNETDREFTLHVGELDGEKEKITVKF